MLMFNTFSIDVSESGSYGEICLRVDVAKRVCWVAVKAD